MNTGLGVGKRFLNFVRNLLLLRRVRTIEYQFRYLTALYAGAVCTLGRTLKLESNIAHIHLAETFLSKVAQFRTVQDSRSCIVRIWFHL